MRKHRTVSTRAERKKPLKEPATQPKSPIASQQGTQKWAWFRSILISLWHRPVWEIASASTAIGLAQWGEYALSVGCWLITGLTLVAKSSQSNVLPDDSAANDRARRYLIFASVAFALVAITFTLYKKNDAPWSSISGPPPYVATAGPIFSTSSYQAGTQFIAMSNGRAYRSNVVAFFTLTNNQSATKNLATVELYVKCGGHFWTHLKRFPSENPSVFWSYDGLHATTVKASDFIVSVKNPLEPGKPAGGLLLGEYPKDFSCSEENKISFRLKLVDASGYKSTVDAPIETIDADSIHAYDGMSITGIQTLIPAQPLYDYGGDVLGVLK